MTEKFSSNGYLEENISNMRDKLIYEDDNQFVLLVVGSTGSSKTSLSLLLDYWLTDGEVDLDTYALTHEQFMKSYTTKPKEKIIVFEEGRESFDRNKHSHTENKEARDALRQYRKFHHTLIINFQDASDLQPELIHNIAHGMIRTPDKGIAHFYGRKDMKKMWNGKDFKGWKNPTFKDYFPDPAKFLPEIWENYEEKAEERLEDNSFDEFDGAEFITPSEAADMIGVSAQTIRNYCDDGVLEYKELKGRGDRRIVKSSMKQLLS